MKLDKFKAIINDTPEVYNDVKRSMDILDRIHYLLEKKFGGKQKLLADKLGKSEAQISFLLSGVRRNYTMSTINKLEAAFGAPILGVCTHEEESNSTYVLVKTTQTITPKAICVTNEGEMEESMVEYHDYK